MTFKILTNNTLKVIHHSDIHSAADLASKNKRIDPLDIDTDIPHIIKSAIEQGICNSFSPLPNHGETKTNEYPEPTSEVAHGEHVLVEMVDPETDPDGEDVDMVDPGDTPSDAHDPMPHMHLVDLQDLVRCTFLLDEQDDGQRYHAKIVECVTNHEAQNQMDPEHVCFCCTVNDDQYEDIIMYNKLMDYIQKNAENDKTLWHFKHISRHQGPLRPGDPHYAGAKYNVQVEWETSEVTYEPLDVIATNDPVTCAVYARDNDLLDLPGWKHFKKLAMQERQLLRLVRQAKMHSYKSSPRYKFGYCIPATFDEALAFNKANGNSKWQEAMALEMKQLFDYDCFKDGGIHGRLPTLKGTRR